MEPALPLCVLGRAGAGAETSSPVCHCPGGGRPRWLLCWDLAAWVGGRKGDTEQTRGWETWEAEARALLGLRQSSCFFLEVFPSRSHGLASLQHVRAVSSALTVSAQVRKGAGVPEFLLTALMIFNYKICLGGCQWHRAALRRAGYRHNSVSHQYLGWPQPLPADKASAAPSTGPKP